MAGILGLGSSGSDILSTENLNSFKEIEHDAYITPIEDDITAADEETTAFESIQEAINDLLSTIEDFDLYTSGVNVFDQFSASTSGDSVVFDAVDDTKLETGIRTVNVTQVAQKDVYQSDQFSSEDDYVMGDSTTSGSITVQIGSGTTYTIDVTGLTYSDLQTKLESTVVGLDTSIEQVSDTKSRLIFKSEETGESNVITFGGDATTLANLGLDDTTNHIQEAQNMVATIGGIEYDSSSDTITTADGLKVTGIATGTSTISITRDTSSIESYLENFVLAYNNLSDIIDKYTLEDDDSPISDKSTFKNIMSTIKSTLMGSYGSDDSINIFSFGFSFDSDGTLTLDSTELATGLSENYDDLKRLFVGVAEDEGIGTILSEYLDDLDGYDGLLYAYEEDLDTKKEDLQTKLDEETEALDDKYTRLAERWAAFTAIITSMENSFASLQAMIDQANSDS